MPTYRASTIVYADGESFARRKERGPDGYSYGLYGAPTTRTLEAQISALHRGARTHLVPSGLAAVTVPMLALLAPGGEVLIPDTVYAPAMQVGAGTFREPVESSASSSYPAPKSVLM
ncbi:PLP-dependent transferase [Herbaspirillum camelliae]|uniref:PLP-dependent transferase n=1 Tax=Herbaspirillum camelliae TaxID=1892903 RepID=UPI00389967B0